MSLERSRPAGKAWLLLGLALLAGLSAWAADMESDGFRLLPAAETSGGHHETVSATNYKLGAAAGQPLAVSTMTSAGTLAVAPGLLHRMSYPGTVTTLTGMPEYANFPSSVTLQWTTPGYDGLNGSLKAGTSYYIAVASFTTPYIFTFDQANIVFSTKDTTPGMQVSTPVYNLWANTTYFASLWTKDGWGNMSFESRRTTFSTLARVPPLLSDPWFEVCYTSVTVQWAALPTADQHGSSNTSEGYLVEASETNFGEVISSSITPAVQLTTMTVFDPPLQTNKLYHFRVGSRNWSGQTNFVYLGSTRTLLMAIKPAVLDPTYVDITSYSVKTQWDPNGNADMALYTLQNSKTPGFASPASSITFASDAAFYDMEVNTTYYFQVRAATGVSTSDFQFLGSTSTLAAPPQVPGLSTFSAVAQTSLDGRWSIGGNAVDVTTYAAVVSSGIWPNGFSGNVLLSQLFSGTVPTATFPGLIRNTTYYLNVAARNHNWVATPFTALSATATLAAPPVQHADPFLDIGDSSMTLRWNANANPIDRTTYTVLASTASDFTSQSGLPYQTSLGTAPLGAFPDATFEGFLPNTTYYFQAKAVNHNNIFTSYAGLGSTATFAALPAAAAVTFLNVNPSSVTFSWDASGNPMGRTTYSVECSTASDFSATAPPYRVILTTVPAYGPTGTFTSLNVNTTYYFRLRARNHNGWMTDYLALGSTSTFVFEPLPFDPAFVEVDQSSISVRWDANGNPLGITTYTVVASIAADFSQTEPPYQISLDTVPVLAAAANIEGLSLINTTYYFQIRARSHGGRHTPFQTMKATSTFAEPPQSPDVSGIFRSSLTLSWAATDAAHYEVTASSTDFGVYKPGGDVILSSTSDSGTPVTSLVLQNLLANSTYYFRLASYNWNNIAEHVTLSSRSTLAPPIVSPQVYRTFLTSVTLNWNELPAAPEWLSAEGYRVDAATADAWGQSDFAGDIVSSATWTGVVPSSLTVENLLPNTTYAFRIGSLNHGAVPNFDALVVSTRTGKSDFSWTGGFGGNWYTAANWTPPGVPALGSYVTIGVTANVYVDASSPSISFSSLTLGSPSGLALASLTLSTNVKNSGSVLIYKGAGLTQATTQYMYFDGDFTMKPGSSMTHQGPVTPVTVCPAAQSYWLDVQVSGTFDLQAGSTINVMGKGWPGGAAGGPFSGCRSGNGGGTGTATNTQAGGGGGYGGAGGAGTGPIAGGTATPVDPIVAGNAGAGGGGGNVRPGAPGGGQVRLRADRMKLDGQIWADGASALNGIRPGGGGSGGGISIETNYIEGTGFLHSTGGAGAFVAGGPYGGGGGGGRISIAVNVAGSACDLKYSVDPGTSGFTNGSLGTVSATSTFTVDGFVGSQPSSSTILWDWYTSTGAVNYAVYSSPGDVLLSGTLAQNATYWLEETGIDANTTYTRYVRALGCGSSTNSGTDSRTTLTKPPVALPQKDTFLDVQEDSLQVAWVALPGSPQKDSSNGYRLEASSTNFSVASPGGVVYSSQTPNVALSTLTVSLPPLEPNTTYYLRVAGLNLLDAVGPFTALGSTSTLAKQVTRLSEDLVVVHLTSATAQWTPRPAPPPQSDAAEGYLLEAWTGPGFTGTMRSSHTPNALLGTLTLEGLTQDTVYNLRVGALNWNGSPHYVTLDSTRTVAEDVGVLVSTHDLNIGDVPVDSELAISTSFIVYSLGNVDQTYELSAATVTVDSPWVVATSSGVDQLTLQALFRADKPASGAFGENDKLAVDPLRCNGIRFEDGQSCVSVPAWHQRLLWFKLGMPRITSTEADQDLRVTIYATPP